MGLLPCKPLSFFINFPFIERLNRSGMVADQQDEPLEVNRRHSNGRLQHNSVNPLGVGRGCQRTFIGAVMQVFGEQIFRVK